jgi:hypothetical protein
LSNSTFDIRRHHFEDIGGEPSIIEVTSSAFKSVRADKRTRTISKKGEKDMPRFSSLQASKTPCARRFARDDRPE